MAAIRTFTVTIASPAVFTTPAAHSLYVGLGIKFTTDGALPTGLTINTTYYVTAVPTATTYRVSTTQGGADVNTTGSQSGTHSILVGTFLHDDRHLTVAPGMNAWPIKGQPLRYIRRSTILVPWRTQQYGGGISLISKT